MQNKTPSENILPLPHFPVFWLAVLSTESSTKRNLQSTAVVAVSWRHRSPSLATFRSFAKTRCFLTNADELPAFTYSLLGVAESLPGISLV